MVDDRAVLVDAAPFPLLFYCDCENFQFGGLNKDARESRVEVVEGGFPCISVQGYIIISKVRIFY